MSWKATTSLVSWTMVAGTSPATILQNRQSAWGSPAAMGASVKSESIPSGGPDRSQDSAPTTGAGQQHRRGGHAGRGSAQHTRAEPVGAGARGGERGELVGVHTALGADHEDEVAGGRRGDGREGLGRGLVQDPGEGGGAEQRG